MIKRKNFVKIKEVYELPYLLDVQLDSYRELLQIDVAAQERKHQGLQEVFEDIFPIEDAGRSIKLEFISYSLGKPKYNLSESQRRGLTFAAPLKVKFRLITPSETKEQDAYFGEIPLMTDTGSFIINGEERVVVSQLQRSPGIFFEEEEHPTGKKIFYARLIPSRGAWLEFKYDLSETILAYVDRKRSFPATQILRILGFSGDSDIISAIGKEYPEITNTLKKDYTKNKEEAYLDFYRKIRPTEPVTKDAAEALFYRLFFDPNRYDLERVGRFIINRKLGMDVSLEKRILDSATVIKVMEYLIKLRNGEGKIDDIDHLGNRRVKTVGELVQNQVRIGMSRIERSIRERLSILSDFDSLSVHHLINSKLLSNQVRDFFGRSQLSQFMDQVNPLAEMTHKRRLSALGPGGLSRERAGFEVRDIHPSHYGRICPIETPEGANIGLIASLSNYARINSLGLLETPYRKVEEGRVTRKIEYLTANIEEEKVIAQANVPLDEDGNFAERDISCRYKNDFPKVAPKQVEYMDVSPKQLVSVAAALIPFLEHDDANRALMGSNMQRQAVPLMITEAPIVGTQMEAKVARDSGTLVVTQASGKVTYVDSSTIAIDKKIYHLNKFLRTNANTALNQRPLVKLGEHVEKGQVIADGTATKNGELALGKNLLVAFMSWRGYNFEDAILINEKILKEDIFTSIHIEEFEIEATETRLGNEEITRDIPNVSEEALKNLDETGIIHLGAEVGPGDILVGKVTPKTESELSPEERLLRAIFGEKASDVRDTSLTVPPGVEGVAIDAHIFQRKERGRKSKEDKTKELARTRELKTYYKQEMEFLQREKITRLSQLLGVDKVKAEKMDFGDNEEAKILASSFDEQMQELLAEEQQEIEKVRRGDELPPGVLKRVVVYIATKRKLAEGDKLAGRHGNKGVVAKILPQEDMPFLSDGTPVDIVLNPLGVPSRMNVGQILETHLGWAAKVLGLHVDSPVFDGATEEEIKEMMRNANLPENGKLTLYDGYNGQPFDQKVTVGYIYMMKLIHMVDEKIHARSIGPYSLVTQQPLGGKAQFGGQRLGEMEVWALEAYGAAFSLQEMLTVKSDDVMGRTRIYEAIVKGEQRLTHGTPESFNVLIKELQGLCLDVKTEKVKEESSLFDSISIKIASPQVIKSWSRGEIKKAETINYRTLKPEKDGLFCEKIFGPVRDWECNCGKYKGIKFKGITCDRCGVTVDRSSVRRERMGHIELAAPVTHVWFFKVVPSRISALLDMSLRDVEKVIYYEEYLVVDSGTTPLKKRELLSEEKYQEAVNKYGSSSFKAKIGAEAIRDLLKELELDAYSRKLRRDLEKSKEILNNRKILKTLKIVEDFKKSANKPDWMVMEVLPVIPPDLRPLVPLDGGRFATSDLNDLYRRVINRNNRLRKLIELSAPEIIIRNEKRMLQEAVDALLDNGRHGRAVMAANNRPLKSLSDMLKGKQGRFRQNLLGKRVDYSGRSVIVIGPELKLHECGLPKQMALELFEPFIIKKLRERGFVHTIKGARRMVERGKIEVWDILDEVIKDHPVLLNRAPTLHRLSIQAFQPVLIEGKSIKIHPLVCTAFNADFDGDQMAVHVPLSLESQIEAKVLMLSINNVFSPADGRPILTPTQDIVLGVAYLSKEKPGARGEDKVFVSSDEVMVAYEDGLVELHARIKLRIDLVFDLDEKKIINQRQIITTTVGRVIFNQVLPKDFGFVNKELNKSNLGEVVAECYKRFGHSRVIQLLDDIKKMGFEFATLGGISIGIDDLTVPKEKQDVLKEARQEVAKVEDQYRKGIITDRERYNKVIDIWTHTTDKVSDLLFRGMDPFNPIAMMADSGARGSRLQIRQLAGMRGLMAKPSGEIIESPITANFREGLTVLEYFISTHGARKGLADTALKTADAGYLTRRLVDVAQEVIITEGDCGTLNGITVSAIIEGDEVVVSLGERIVGRVALDNIVNIITDEVVLEQGSQITEEKAVEVERLGIEKIRIRSVLTCESERGVCAKCYGRNLATGRLVEVGEAVGIIAAQSIGEPGTQLTMRTFHIGGTASRIVAQSFIKSKNKGIVKYHSLRVAPKNKEYIVLNRNGSISINDKQGRELERYTVPQGAFISIADEKELSEAVVFVRWDPYTLPILTEVGGFVKYEDLREDVTVREELNPVTKLTERVVVEHKQEYHPQILILDESKQVMGIYPIPMGAHILIKDGQKVDAGDLLAKIPRLVVKTRDITGGLPRVAELFEARRPKEPAVISEIDGFIEFSQTKKGQRVIIVKSPTGMEREYTIPHGKHPNVYKGDKVIAGQQLTDGPVVLQDILRVCGDKILQEYLVNEVQEVYRLQGVRINDKHIELIIRQMLKKVRIEDPGDTDFLPIQQVDKWKFQKENMRVIKKDGKPASATPLLLGITKSSLTTESFISAASFQETTRVLTEAATAGKRDELFGLKENVIVGHLIPAGTGFRDHRDIEVVKLAGDKKKEEESLLEVKV